MEQYNLDSLAVKKLAAEMLYNSLKILSNKKSPEKRQEEREWITEGSEKLFGYRWCVNTCGVKPSFIKEIISSIENGNSLKKALKIVNGATQ